jgi:hypothetical protein
MLAPAACHARGGALAGGPAAASRRQGSRLEHHRHAADAPGKKSGCGAHRGGLAAVGWREAASAVPFYWRAAPARRRHPRGGPTARDGVEGGAADTASERKRNTWRGGEKIGRGGSSSLLKVGGGDAADGGSGGGHRVEGGNGEERGGPWARHRTAQRHGGVVALQRRAVGCAWCGHARQTCGVGCPWGPAGSDGVRGENDA